MSHRLLAYLVLPGLLAVVPWAHADAAADKAAAEGLFREGRRLMEAGDYTAACDKLRRSNEVDSATGTLLNLAECYEKSQRYASAWATYNSAAASARARGQAPREELASRRAKELEARLSRLVIRAPAPNLVPGLVVFRDGAEIPPAMLGEAIPIDGGVLELRASAPGRKEWTTRVEIPLEGERVELTIPVLELVEPEPEPESEPVSAGPGSPPPTMAPAPMGPATPDPTLERKPNLAVLGLLGASGAAFLTAGGFALAAWRTHETSLEYCRSDNPDLCTAHGVDVRDSARSFGNVATIATTVGVATLGSAVIAHFASRPRGSAARAPRAATHATAESWVVVQPGTAAFVVRTRW